MNRWTIAWRRGRALAFLVAVAPALVACGQGKGPTIPANCLDEKLPDLPLPKGADPNGQGKEAVLQVEQTDNQLTATQSGLFRLFFNDLSTYQSTPAQQTFDSGNCWRVIGQPQVSSPPTALTVDQVQVGGIVGGTADVGQVTGHYQSTAVSQVMGSQDLSLSSKAVTTANTPTFPDLNISGPVAAPIENLKFSRSALGDDMQMNWKAGHGSYLLVELYTQDPAHPGDTLYRNRVICRIVDDGCHRIPAASLDWLSIYGSTANVQVERHRLTETSPDQQGTLATIDATQTQLNAVDLKDGHFSKGGNP